MRAFSRPRCGRIFLPVLTGIHLSQGTKFMRVMRFFHATRILCGVGIVGAFAVSNGCDSSQPAAQVQQATGGDHGKKEADARLKAYGTTGDPGKEAAPKKFIWCAPYISLELNVI